jgi:hypothetical protein
MIEVRIDELVLDRGSGLEPDAIRAATERALAGPPSPHPTDVSRSLDAAHVGRELAATVRREVASQ